MVRLLIVSLLVVVFDAFAAPASRPVAGRVAPQRQTATAGQQQNVAQQPTTQSAVRAARTPGVAVKKSNTPSTLSVGRSAVKPTGTTATPKVAARAAKQSAIVGGTKINAAAKNVSVDSECKEKFDGCMDSFCMMADQTGGRCLCSNKVTALDALLEKIQSDDKKSYELATAGVEKIEMGERGDAVFASVNSIKDEITGVSKEKKDKWADFFKTDSETIEEKVSDVRGDELYKTSYDLCTEYMPECKSSFQILDTFYRRQVQSDCAAYENALKKESEQSAQKLQAAQTAMREAALEQYKSSNKYDLGECTLQFKQCMKTTGGCGEDFSGCATIAGATEAQNATHSRKKLSKPYKIKGATTIIEIAATTYDTLLAKKPLCMGVTKNCVNVRDQVWDAFLREAAPEIKSAELIAEDKFRTSCVTNISNCFQKACKDNMDPNDPDGSYDMCLSRPQVFESLCKVQIQPCVAPEPNIMESVLAKLQSMRTDACTSEFKECLTSEDRCGSDYTKCIGLDTATIVAMCPTEKLTACYQQYNNKTMDVYETLVKIADGIFLNIDNNMYETCQKALDESMIKVCGATDNCDNLALDSGTGTRSFKYQVCEYDGFKSGTNEPNWTGRCYESIDVIPKSQYALPGNRGWAGKLTGVVYWGSISYDNESNTFTSFEEYVKTQEQLTGQPLNEEQKKIIRDQIFNSEIKALTNSVTNAIKSIEADQKVKFCMTGRQFQSGMRDSDGNVKMLGNGTARFPNLTKQVRQIIAASALRTVQQRYMQKYDSEMSKMLKDRSKMARLMDQEFDKENAQKACDALKDSLALPTHKSPQIDNTGLWIAMAVVIVATIVASIFTFGGASVGGYAAIAGIQAAIQVANTVSVAALAAGEISAIVGVAALAGTAAGLGGYMAANPIGPSKQESWNYVYIVDTKFNPETGVCTKTVSTQNCKKISRNYCKKWDEVKTTTETINLL